MLLSLVYFAVCRLLHLLSASRDRDDAAREIEILVLRHQLRVLSRGSESRGRLLPRKLWRSFPVSSQTLLAGTAISLGARGPTAASDGPADLEWKKGERRLSFGWQGRTRAGGTGASRLQLRIGICPPATSPLTVAAADC
jgi:hypothetical protein